MKKPRTAQQELDIKIKMRAARKFVSAVARGEHPISNTHFHRICQTFNIKTK
jgi:hypothetical protein